MILFYYLVELQQQKWFFYTGKFVSEALILESVNPQYDDRLFINSWLQYKKNTSWEHVVYKNCFECQNQNKKQILYTIDLSFASTETKF